MSGRDAGAGKKVGIVTLGKIGVVNKIGAGRWDKYLLRKSEIAGPALSSIVVVDPEIFRVMFGLVKLKGSTLRLATWAVILSAPGMET